MLRICVQTNTSINIIEWYAEGDKIPTYLGTSVEGSCECEHALIILSFGRWGLGVNIIFLPILDNISCVIYIHTQSIPSKAGSIHTLSYHTYPMINSMYIMM